MVKTINWKSFVRREKFLPTRIVVIATEGEGTETVYFEAVKGSLCSSRVKMEVLKRETRGSSPENVLKQIKAFERRNDFGADDQLWVVIDTDRWPSKTLSDVARQCDQDRYLHLCVSNPCFELWLILHYEDVFLYSDEQKKELAENRKNSRSGETWAKRRIRFLLGSYQEADYNVAALLPNTQTAIDRAVKLDISPSDRWPQTIGTRVYRLVKSIMDIKE